MLKTVGHEERNIDTENLNSVKGNLCAILRSVQHLHYIASNGRMSDISNDLERN
jgi:hypothetical protein